MIECVGVVCVEEITIRGEEDLADQGIVNALMRDAPASLQVIFDARRLARGLASGSTFP